MANHYLHHLFSPRSIAVYGASEDESSAATVVLRNLIESQYTGKVFVIYPDREELFGAPCFKSIDAINEHVDMAVMATPAETVPGLMRECGEAGVKHAMVLSSGFSDAGKRGLRLEKDMIDLAKKYGMYVIGPNCLGIMRPAQNLNATFSHNKAVAGNVALVSQSGALCTAILDWAESRNVGFSTVVSLGDAADVDFGQVLDFLALDHRTDSILLYVETIRDARSFMSGLRAASRMKPVVVIKAGRYSGGMSLPNPYSATRVTEDDAFCAALERAGVVRAHSITQVLSTAQILSAGMRVNRNRLTVITNGGGPGLMAADRAIDMGLKVPVLETSTLDKLDALLPKAWSHSNPVDLLGDATPERYEQALRICLEDNNTDGVLVIMSPQAGTDPVGIAEAVVRVNTDRKHKKPILACWMGEMLAESGRAIFNKTRIAHFRTPESAIEAFSYLASYRQNQKLLMQTPSSINTHREPDIEGARMIIEGVLAEGRRTLTTIESKAVLSAFRIPVVHSILTRNPAEALVAAESVGFPVVMKISSPDLHHKTDVDGVRLNVPNAAAVRLVYQEMMLNIQQHHPELHVEGITVEHMHAGAATRELMVGISRDPVFGPVVSFGMGGTAVDVHNDRAVALPPLNDYMINKMISQTRVSRLLAEFRNMPQINCEALKEVLLRVSEMACELPELIEMDLNPLMADPEGVIAVDVRLTVAYPSAMQARYGHMAIHPYPSYLSEHIQTVDGQVIHIRPIRPEDAELEQEFVRNLSEESRYMRFMQAVRELTPDILMRFTQIDYDREMCFVALLKDKDGAETQLGVSRYSINPDGESCEFALAVGDAWQHRGLGSQLMRILIKTARAKGLKHIEGDVLANNTGMLKLMTRLGFDIEKQSYDDGIVLVRKKL